MTRLLSLLLIAAFKLSALTLGTPPPEVTLAGDTGGTVEGKSWSSSSLRGKVHILFYVDPDKKDTNNDLSEALKARAFDRSRYSSVAVINMAATWLPNFVIASSLRAKQERYPDTLYVKDKRRVLVNTWGIADDSSDILLFDRGGNLLYLHEGKVDKEGIDTIIQLIEEHL
jgi:predicted transcriptional regulator